MPDLYLVTSDARGSSGLIDTVAADLPSALVACECLLDRLRQAAATDGFADVPVEVWELVERWEVQPVDDGPGAQRSHDYVRVYRRDAGPAPDVLALAPPADDLADRNADLRIRVRDPERVLHKLVAPSAASFYTGLAEARALLAPGG